MMSKRRASPGYRDAFNYYNSLVYPLPSSSLLHPSGPSTLGSYSLQSSDGDNQELHSDSSVEEDVIQLNCKVQKLVEQVVVLVEDQAHTENNFTRFKQESASFTTRIVILEEHIKEIERRGEDHLQEVQRKNKFLMDSKEREKQLEIENYSMRYQSLEKDHMHLLKEIKELRRQEGMVMQDKKTVENQLLQTEQLLLREQEQHSILQKNMARKVEEWGEERKATCHLVQEMAREVDEFRDLGTTDNHFEKQMKQSDTSEVFGDLTGRIVEMETESKQLREENGSYRETIQEMEVAILTKGLEEGRHLLITHDKNNSLAAELGNMNENEMRISLSKQKDINSHLQRYIDSVLLNIMERYPELLEVANK